MARFGRIHPTATFIQYRLGILYVSGNVCFNLALEQSNAPLIGTIAASFTAVTVILSVIFFGEQLSPLQLIAIILIFIGIVLSTLRSGSIRTIKLVGDYGIKLALWSMIAWGTYFSVVRILIERVGWFWPHYIAFGMFIFIAPLLFLRGEKLKNPITSKAVFPILVSAVLLRTGDFAFNYAISHSLTAVVAPIAGSYATLFVFLSFLIFKDPIKRHQIMGIVVTLCGIVMLAILTRS